MDFVLKMMEFVLKMMDFVATRAGVLSLHHRERHPYSLRELRTLHTKTDDFTLNVTISR